MSVLLGYRFAITQSDEGRVRCLASKTWDGGIMKPIETETCLATKGITSQKAVLAFGLRAILKRWWCGLEIQVLIIASHLLSRYLIFNLSERLATPVQVVSIPRIWSSEEIDARLTPAWRSGGSLRLWSFWGTPSVICWSEAYKAGIQPSHQARGRKWILIAALGIAPSYSVQILSSACHPQKPKAEGDSPLSPWQIYSL